MINDLLGGGRSPPLGEATRKQPDSGSAPQQHSRAQLAPQAQARPSAATPRRRARPARLPPRQPGARGARLAHPRALRGACPGALRIGARAGAAPLAQRGHHWPPRRPPSGAAANYSRCAAQGLRPRLHAGITQNVAFVQPGRSRVEQKLHILCNVAMRPSQPPRACGPPCPPAGAARPPAPVASRQHQRAESERMRGLCPRRPRARR